MEDKVRGFSKSGAANMARLERGARATAEASRKVAVGAGIAGAAILAPLALAANAAIGFEDRMADVAKTTQLAGVDLQNLSNDILVLAPSTRTPIEGLQKIAEIGGQMGITSRKGILDFTGAVDKFNVALGGDFQGGVEEAARAIGSLNSLFKETRNLEIADSITKAGSAINALSAKGVQVPELTEFIKRVGQLPDAIKPSIQNTAALGAVFNKAGITAEIASRAVGDVLLTATQNAPAFAKQMGISEKALTNLLNTDPTAFLMQFSKSLIGVKGSDLGNLLKSLKLGDSGSIKAVGALSSNIERLTEFQALSNEEFSKGTSILNEFNVKNETTAARIAKAKNSFEVFTILLGQELLPVINKIILKIIPLVKETSKWITENKGLVKNVAIAAGAIGGFLLVVSGVSSVVYGVSTAITGLTAAFTFLTGPIGLTILAVAAVTAAVVAVIAYWDQWGASITAVTAAVAAFISPLVAGLLLVISLVQSFINNWDGITKAFSDGNFLQGILLIGSTIQDAILYPIQQILELAGKLTGIEMFSNAAGGLKNIRRNMGLNVGDEKYSKRDTSAFTLPGELSQDGLNSFASAENGGSSVQMANPKLAQQEGLTNSFETVQRQNVEILIKDKTGQASVKSDNNIVPVKLGSTMQP
jgi:tubulin-specific chaperone A